ncbi:MAG: Smr/MutS family protein [Hyphomicrobiales bacterium]
MARKNSGKPPRDREDLSLWEKVARTVAPLKRGRDRIGKLTAAPEMAPAVPRAKAERRPKPEAGPVETPQPKRPPPLNRFDAREQRRLVTGRAEIDARIDLHGMRQREAHSALRAFLLRSQSRGHRIVLVITGKGAPQEASRTTGEGRGVLRRAVPMWLEEPDLRQVVVSHATAHIRHGGEGALYVRLRRAKR